MRVRVRFKIKIWCGCGSQIFVGAVAVSGAVHKFCFDAVAVPGAAEN